MRTFSIGAATLAAGVALAACVTHGGGAVLPQPGSSGDTLRPAGSATYAIARLANLGAPGSGANSINDRAWVAGFSAVKGGAVHAALWAGGTKTDLGTLGGANSGIEWPNPNVDGLLAGISETATVDPYKESWSCGAFIPADGHTCAGFAWQHRKMTALANLGGNNGYAASANNAGTIVGWAETSKHDSTCTKGHVLQFLPVTWSGSSHAVVALTTYEGDPDGAATGINASGEIVGISGICDQDVGRFSARHALLWKSASSAPTNLGSLGGASWNTPAAIDDNGDVAGFSDLRGDKGGVPNFHAFLWLESGGGMKDLGTLPGDAYSEALGLNDRGAVVGASYAAGFASSRGFVWKNGAMTDANALIGKAAKTISILYINDVNAKGQIAGVACTLKAGKCSGAPWAFIGTPAVSQESRP